MAMDKYTKALPGTKDADSVKRKRAAVRKAADDYDSTWEVPKDGEGVVENNRMKKAKEYKDTMAKSARAFAKGGSVSRGNGCAVKGFGKGKMR